MLLTKTQKQILEVIREFGGLKFEMLFELTGRPRYFNKLINELRNGGRLFPVGAYLCDEEKQVCGRETESAFEVMIQLCETSPKTFLKGVSPFELTFFKEKKEKLFRYDVCIVPVGKEILKIAQLEGIDGRDRIICIVLEDLSRGAMLNIPCEHCFAIKDKGKYRFYK